MKKIKLSQKLILSFIIAIIIPILAMSYIELMTSKNILESNLKLTSMQTINESHKGLVAYLKSLSGKVDFLTRKQEVKKYGSYIDPEEIKTNADLMKDSLTAALRSMKGSVRVYYSTESGQKITIWYSYDAEGKKTQHVLEEKNSKFTTEDWYLGALEADGEFRDDIWAYYTEPYLDTETDQLIITVSQRITGIGVVGIDIEYSYIEEFIHNIDLLNTGFAVLVNSKGDVLVNSDDNTYFKDSIANEIYWKDIQHEELKHFALDVYDTQMNIISVPEIITGWTLVGFISNTEIESSLNTIKNITLFTLIFGIIFGIIIAILTTRNIVKGINQVKTCVDQVAEYDFTNKIEMNRQDEIGQLGNQFNIMLDNVSDLIRKVLDESHAINKISGDVTDLSSDTKVTVDNVSLSIEEVAQGNTKQVQSILINDEHIGTLSSQLEESKTSVAQLNDDSTKAKKLSAQGIAILGELIEKSAKAKENSKLSTAVVNEMSKSVDSINFISDAIYGITQQTNLLALNASIEAARAGDAGKGFAVVAEEIRKLAVESETSTNEIKHIVEDIHKKTQTSTLVLTESEDILNENDQAIKQTQIVFDDILALLESLINGLDQMSALNIEMIKRKNIVTEEMSSILAISEGTAAASEEVSASTIEVNQSMDQIHHFSEELSIIARTLKSEVERFKL